MASRTNISVSGHYFVSISTMPFHIPVCTVNFETLKSRTESYFILF